MIPDPLLDALHRARHVVVFSGAGVSAESGIPTFRDSLTGLWERFDAASLATPEAFRADPALVWGWYEWRRMKVLQAQPNPAHMAIAELARHVPRLTLVTQNVDDVFRRHLVAITALLHTALHRRAHQGHHGGCLGIGVEVRTGVEIPMSRYKCQDTDVEVSMSRSGSRLRYR